MTMPSRSSPDKPRNITANQIKLEKIDQLHRTIRATLYVIGFCFCFWVLNQSLVKLLADSPEAIVYKAIAAVLASLAVPSAFYYFVVRVRSKYVTSKKFGRTAELEAELDRNRTSSQMSEDGTQIRKGGES